MTALDRALLEARVREAICNFGSGYGLSAVFLDDVEWLAFRASQLDALVEGVVAEVLGEVPF